MHSEHVWENSFISTFWGIVYCYPVFDYFDRFNGCMNEYKVFLLNTKRQVNTWQYFLWSVHCEYYTHNAVERIFCQAMWYTHIFLDWVEFTYKTSTFSKLKIFEVCKENAAFASFEPYFLNEKTLKYSVYEEKNVEIMKNL